jgi:hypothetical protein
VLILVFTPIFLHRFWRGVKAWAREVRDPFDMGD